MNAFKAPEFKHCDQCGARFHRDKRNTWRHWHAAKFCSRKCSAARSAEIAAAKRLPLSESFARWIDKSGDCWLWTGALDKDGYGIFTYEGKTYRAPAMALRLDGRPVPDGQYACHHCDTPACVKPGHLYPGTPFQNSCDARLRGRTPKGEAVYCARLTEADVVAIRSDPRPSTAVAPEYGVTPSNIQAIRRRDTWRHVA